MNDCVRRGGALLWPNSAKFSWEEKQLWYVDIWHWELSVAHYFLPSSILFFFGHWRDWQRYSPSLRLEILPLKISYNCFSMEMNIHCGKHFFPMTDGGKICSSMSGKEYVKNMHLVAVKFRWVFAWDMNKSNIDKTFGGSDPRCSIWERYCSWVPIGVFNLFTKKAASRISSP